MCFLRARANSRAIAPARKETDACARVHRSLCARASVSLRNAQALVSLHACISLFERALVSAQLLQSLCARACIGHFVRVYQSLCASDLLSARAYNFLWACTMHYYLCVSSKLFALAHFFSLAQSLRRADLHVICTRICALVLQ